MPDDMVLALLADTARLREINRRLRLVNGMLRRNEYKRLSAESALGELWGSGSFDCGPQDYSYMVVRCIEALDAKRAMKAAPTPSAIMGRPYRHTSDS